MEALKKLARNLKLDNNNGYVVSVLIALIFVSSVLIGYYVMLRPPQRGYMTIYLLDSQRRAIDYPELLVINQNSTFDVLIEVENYMGKSQYSEVLLKVTNDTVPLFPFKGEASATYTRTLENGKTWEISPTISIDKPGNYSVIFELWVYDEKVEELEFSGNVCVLNVQVVDQA